MPTMGRVWRFVALHTVQRLHKKSKYGRPISAIWLPASLQYPLYVYFAYKAYSFKEIRVYTTDKDRREMFISNRHFYSSNYWSNRVQISNESQVIRCMIHHSHTSEVKDNIYPHLWPLKLSIWKLSFSLLRAFIAIHASDWCGKDLN